MFENRSSLVSGKRQDRSRVFTVASGLVAALILACPLGAAAEYPDKPIKWVVMWRAGGGADTATRALTKHMEKYLGQEIIVENITGGGGSIGYLAAKATKPDGYNLVTIQADLPKFRAIEAAPIDIDDFDIIGSHAYQSPMLATRSDATWKTMNDFIADANTHPNKYTVGVSDLFGAHNQPVALLEDLAGIQVRSVAHEGSPQMTAAILGGQVDLVSNWVRPMIPHIADGKLRLLAYGSAQRHAGYPDVPTLRELGYDVVIEFPYGVGGPKGMPEEAKRKLTEALAKAWEEPELREDLAKRGLTLFRKMGEDYRQHLIRMQRDIAKSVALIKAQTQ